MGDRFFGTAWSFFIVLSILSIDTFYISMEMACLVVKLDECGQDFGKKYPCSTPI
jgi:hypothetical protein